MKIVKIAAWVVGGLLALMVIAAIAVPLFVDVDKYRPQIVKAANDNMNGKLELGKLKLSLWGQIKIQVDGLKLADARGNKIVSVNEAFFHVPFTSIFAGAPLLTLKMNEPQINVLKDKAGKLNVMTLAKEGNLSTAPGGSGGAAGKGDANQKTSLPAIASRARLGVDIQNALIVYQDQTTGLKSETKNFNLKLRDISLSREMEGEASMILDTKMAAVFSVKGPFELEFKADPRLEGTDFKSANVSFNIDADDLDISVPGTFHKAAGTKANGKGSLTVTQNDADIKDFVFNFHNLVLTAKGLVGKNVNFKMGTNDVSLESWGELIPPLKEHKLKGTLKFDAEARGPQEKLDYSADFTVKEFTFKGPGMKADPVINASIKILTDQLQSLLVTMKAPGNDLKLSGKLVNFAAPKGDFALTSSGMDLDQIMAPSPKKEEKKSEEKAESGKSGGGGGSGEAGKGKEDYDASLDALRKNEFMAKTRIAFVTDIKKIKMQGSEFKNIKGVFDMNGLEMNLKSFGVELFDGSLGLSAGTNLRPKQPTYSFKANIKDFDMKKAVESNFELFKNTLIGKLQFSMQGSGASFNPTPATQNLNASGNFKVANAKFVTIDVNKMVTEGINGALDKVAGKIPALKGKGIKKLPNREAEYEVISSDFNINGGVFSAPNFVAKSKPNQSFDLAGATKANMINYDLDTSWIISDTYNLTGAKDISVSQGGVEVQSILAEPGQPVKIPVSAKGKLNNPQYNYGEIPEHFTKVALANTTRAATGKAKQEAAKQIDKIKQNAPEPAKKVLDGIGKKLFGR